MAAERRWQRAIISIIVLLLAGGGLALAARALLGGGSSSAPEAGEFPVVAPTPTATTVIPDVSPGGPKLLFAEHYPEPLIVGEQIEFAVDWKGSSGAVRALICKTPQVSEGQCSNGAWAYGRSSPRRPALAHLKVSLDHLGSNPYYVFVCDDLGECGPRPSVQCGEATRNPWSLGQS